MDYPAQRAPYSPAIRWGTNKKTGPTAMNAVELCERYRDALNRKDLLAIQGLFTADAIVKAPISGTAGVTEFHTYLFLHAKKTIARFPNVLSSRDKPVATTLQFSYTFLAASGELAELDGIATFDIDERLGKIKGLIFVYNAEELRRLMDRAGIAPPATATRS